MTDLTRRAALRLAASAAALPLLAVSAHAAANAAAHTVVISNFTFSPAALQINAGDSVTFVNQDSAPHTATMQGAFDTGTLQQGQSATLTFPGAAQYNYICSIHPKMAGAITVR